MSNTWKTILLMTVILLMGFAVMSSDNIYGNFSDNPNSMFYKAGKKRDDLDGVVNKMFKTFSSENK